MESKFYVIGFVPADVVCLKKDVWFANLDSEQVRSVDQFLAGLCACIIATVLFSLRNCMLGCSLNSHSEIL